MRKIIDYATWGILAIFALPSILILGSWKSLPGDYLYPVKIALENGLLLIVKPSYAASGTLSVKYTERRLEEAYRLLETEQSAEGLLYLERQIGATLKVIERAPNKTAKKKLARSYLETLRNIVTRLEVQKQVIVDSHKTTKRIVSRKPTKTYDPTPTTVAEIRVETTVTETTQVPQEQNSVEEQITDTQDSIDETIEELEEITNEPENREPELTPTPTPENPFDPGVQQSALPNNPEVTTVPRNRTEENMDENPTPTSVD